MRWLVVLAALLSPAVVPLRAASAQDAPLVIHNSANHQVVTVIAGQPILVDLRSVAWYRPQMRPRAEHWSTSSWYNFTDSVPGVLTAEPPIVYSERPGSVRGQYIDHSMLSYRATGLGSVTLTATAERRVRCGVAVQNCPLFEELKVFAVTVTVVVPPSARAGMPTMPIR